MDLATFSLDDEYTATSGRVYLTGIQAMVHLLPDQHRRDAQAGLDTAAETPDPRGLLATAHP